MARTRENYTQMDGVKKAVDTNFSADDLIPPKNGFAAASCREVVTTRSRLTNSGVDRAMDVGGGSLWPQCQRVEIEEITEHDRIAVRPNALVPAG
jgi:hypothetical protein